MRDMILLQRKFWFHSSNSLERVSPNDERMSRSGLREAGTAVQNVSVAFVHGVCYVGSSMFY